MGMAASQARMLSLTSRLSDLELQAQQISNSKIRLAVDSQDASKNYSDALDKEKLSVLTGYNDSSAVYSDLNYSLLTGVDSPLLTQYGLSDNNGNILVSQEMATKFDDSDNLDDFLEAYGTEVTKTYSNGLTQKDYDDADKWVSDSLKTLNETPEYITLSGQGLDQYIDNYYNELETLQYKVRGLEEAYWQMDDQSRNDQSERDGQLGAIPTQSQIDAAYKAWQDEQLILDKKQTEYNKLINIQSNGGSITVKNDPAYTTAKTEYDAAVAARKLMPDPTVEYTSKNADYYTNMYNRMCDGYITVDDEENTLNNQNWIQNQMMSGNLIMEQVNSDGEWETTSWKTNSNIIKDTDDTDTAKAEAEYDQEMAEIETKDVKFDLSLKTIDTEHSAIQTEIESVKKVIDKNIERSFKIFDA